MNRFVLSLGTNMGDRSRQLREAKERISHEIGVLTGESSVYETAAWGNQEQPAFHNQVVTGDTILSPEEVMEMILHIEAGMGRKRLVKWSPRVIDIDILFYNDSVIKSEQISIPHPMFHLRRFTLVPLVELMPDFRDPLSGKSMRKLLEELNDDLEVRKLG